MIHNELHVFEVRSEEEREVLHEYMNLWAAEAYDKAFTSSLTLCKNENQRRIFTDWWNGKCVSTDEYKVNFSDEDNYEAGSVILHTVSMGFG